MKNAEWLSGDSKELHYHLSQYDTPKEYTKMIIKYIENWNLLQPGDRTLDLGCGAGANCFYFGSKFKLNDFKGIDLNPKYIDMALQYKLPNTDFLVGDATNIKEIKKGEYSGIFSLQTLSWIKSYQKSMRAMFGLQPDWILITSLFYDGPVDVNILVTDYSKRVQGNKARKSNYNIYSLEYFKIFANKYKYDIARSEIFDFPFDLPRPIDRGMGTYTERKLDNKIIQVSGPLLMPWYTLLLRRSHVLN